jgi:uncharacterized protein (TIGR02118 family)
MFKAIILLKRGENMSHDEFKQWWLVDHSGKAAQLPGVRKIVFNLVDDGSAYDGVSELWFDSKEDFEAAYATEIGKGVAADSLAHLSARERMFVVENDIL